MLGISASGLANTDSMRSRGHRLTAGVSELKVMEYAPATRAGTDDEGGLVTEPTGVPAEYIQTSFQVENNEIFAEGARRITLYLDSDNGKIWFKNLIGEYSEGWVYGDISGDKVVLRSRQPLGYDGDRLIRLGMGTASEAGQPVYADEVEMQYDATSGEIRLPAGVYLFAVYYGAVTNTLRGYAVEHKLRPMPEKIEMPAEAAVKEYLVQGFSTFNQMNGTKRTLTVGNVGSIYYLKGLSIDSPHDIMVGTRSGNEITVANGQFAHGVAESVLAVRGVSDIRFNTESGVISSKSEDAIRLQIDDADGTISLPDGFGICEAPWGYPDEGSWDVMTTFEMKPKTEADKPAVPMTPESIFYLGTGFNCFYITLDNVDVDGNYINENNLEYELLINDMREPYKFKPETYTCLDDETSRIPFEMLDFTFFSGFSTYRVISYTGNVSNAGVRCVYTVDGKECYSDTRYLDGSTSGVEDVAAADGVPVRKVYIDMLGNTHLETPERGIYVEVTTYADGRRESRKITI